LEPLATFYLQVQVKKLGKKETKGDTPTGEKKGKLETSAGVTRSPPA